MVLIKKIIKTAFKNWLCPFKVVETLLCRSCRLIDAGTRTPETPIANLLFVEDLFYIRIQNEGIQNRPRTVEHTFQK